MAAHKANIELHQTSNKYWCPQYQEWLSLEELAYRKLTEDSCTITQPMIGLNE